MLSPEAEEYFHVTSFSARPNQKIRRIFAKADALLRNTARIIFKNGVGKRDVYTKK
jgi:hypothetical protein